MEDYKAMQNALRMERLALAQAIAKALGAAVQKPSEDEHYACAYLTMTLNGRDIGLHFYAERGVEKISISGNYPREKTADGSTRYMRPRDLGVIGYNDAEPQIGVTASKGAEAIAKDITRRFMPEFTRVYDACVEKIKANETAGREALAAARALAQKYGTLRELKGDGQSATFWHNETGRITVSAWRADGVSVDFERRLFGLTLKQAEKILAVLSEK